MIEIVLFAIILIVASFFFYKNVSKVRRNILLGKETAPVGNKPERWKLVMLNALGQKKMFERPIPAILHFFVYIGFVIINIEVLEIILDGLTGQHRIFASFLGGFYNFLISFFEVLAVLVLLSCVVFLFRRHLMGIKRFQSPELSKFPKVDANIILYTEIILMSALLILNASDVALQIKGVEHYHPTGGFLMTSWLSDFWAKSLSTPTLIVIERGGWWFHILGILAFLNYLPISKHLHIILSFPNTFYSKLSSQGKINNMPEVEREVKMMLFPETVPLEEQNISPPERFGAKDIKDLEWKDILGAYSCTECGRCTSVCPASITGKKLSPRKIMMDTRDRAEEVGKGIDKNGTEFQDGKSLLGDYITREELLACTSCQACVEACPININPLDIIYQLKRYVILDEAASPSQWNNMFSNIETVQTPWQFNPGDRFNWAKEF